MNRIRSSGPHRSKEGRRSARYALVAATTLGMLAATLAGCGGSGNAGGLFKTTCADIGKRPSNLKNSTPTEVIVLLDVNSNDSASAKRIADDTAAVLDDVLSTHDDLIVTGFAAGGTDESLTKIECMDSAEYFFGGGNKRRQETERADLKDEFSAAMVDAVKKTTVADTGDARVLLRKVKTIATKPGAQVILWSSFLEQGSDCLAFQPDDHPAAELAQSVAQRCAQQNLLPDLRGAKLTVVGAGTSPDRPDLGAFGKLLAGALCAQMTDSCDIR